MNKIQEKTFEEVLRLLKDAHTVDILIRNNGKDYRFEADWLKEVIEKGYEK